MKLVLLFLILLLGGTSFSQIDSIPRVEKKLFIDKLFYQDSLKHQLILDAQIIPINLGLNYYYHFNSFFALGTRIGETTFKGQHMMFYNERITHLQFELLGSVKTYKSIRIELGLGVENTYVTPSKVWLNPYVVARTGISLNLFKYFFLRGGEAMSYNIEDDYYFFSPYVGIGATIKL